MPPAFFQTNTAHLANRDAEVSCDRGELFAGGSPPANFNDMLVNESAHTMLGTLGAPGEVVTDSPLSGGVRRVLGRTPEKKMVGTNTRGVIALVAHKQSVRDRPVGAFVGKTMGGDMFSLDHVLAISVSTPTSLPQPTFARAIDVLPEPLVLSCPPMVPPTIKPCDFRAATAQAQHTLIIPRVRD